MISESYTLGIAADQVEEIAATRNKIEHAMRHASPAAIDSLRTIKAQLEETLEFIMNSDVTCSVNLTELVNGFKISLRSCTGNINDASEVIGRTRL